MNEQDRCEAISLAERELSAFILLIQRLGGAEAAERAALDWIDALEQLDCTVNPEFDWRKITIAAASRYASHQATHRAAESS